MKKRTLAGLLGMSGGGLMGGWGVRRPWGLAAACVVGCAAGCAVGLVGSALLGLNEACAQEQAVPAEKADVSAGYSRVREIENDGGVELQISSRTMVPTSGDGPLVRLVGVTHIGDKAYYDHLQTYLDGQDLVLFEGVKPAGTDAPKGEAKEQTEEEKAKRTERRLRIMAMLAERYRRDHQELPGSIDELMEGLGGPTKKLAKSAMDDAWGKPIAYVLTAGTAGEDGTKTAAKFDFVSLGSDGAEGGEGAAQDLRFSMQKPLTKDEKTGGGGLQENLARSLGLSFQLLAIDYDRKNWRNSDMSIDQVQKDLADLGASGDMLFKMLDGSSMSAKVVNLILMVVRSSPTMAASAKVMLIEMLANADALLEQGGGGLENTGALMKVIVGHRNDAVLADLKAAMAETTEPRPKTIALFYGAGHLPDLKSKLETMGYKLDASRDEWFTAIRVSTVESGLPASQVKMMRDMISKSMGSMGGKGKADPKKDAE